MPWPPPSTLPTTPFPNRGVAVVATVASALLTPGSWMLDWLLALLVPTTAQRAQWRQHWAGLWIAVTVRVLAVPALLLALVLVLPTTLLGFLVWLPAQAKRQPVVCQSDPTAVTPGPWDARRARGFTVVTANVCLLPSGMARFSNLGRTQHRAEVIGGMVAVGGEEEGSGHREGLLEGRRGEGRRYGGVGGATEEGRWDGGVVGGMSVPAGNGMTWSEMAMVNPTPMANSTPVTNPMLMTNSTPLANPTPMTNPWPTVDSLPMPELPMTNSTPVTSPTSVTNPMMTNTTSMTNPWPTMDSVPTLELLMTNSTPMTNPTPVTNPMMANPTLMTNPTMTNPTMTNSTPMTNTTMPNPTLSPSRLPLTSPPPEHPIPLPDPMPPVLTTRLPPDADLVCLQEVFDSTAAATLCRCLGRRFPHVLWGVGPGGLRGGQLKVMGSGLVVASQWPVLAACFHTFPVAAREDALANKGLLVVQVLLGTRQGRRVVGYLGCTHLQAPATDVTIRDQQLSLSLRWLRDFQWDQQRPGDLVAFDVLCGDLNFDNCSQGDAQNQRHPLFQEFWDPAQRQPGQDQPWAIGTLLDYLKIYEEPVSTPERMERTLSDPRGRAQFLAGPLPPCDPTVTPVTPPATPATQPWQGRRVDRVLLRRDPKMPTEVTGYSVITQLATLSDHLPVALRLRLGPADL